MTDAEAVKELERLARTLARRCGDMVAGYITVSIGAGNPDFFFEVWYKRDGYGPSGGVDDSPAAVIGHGPTLPAAVEMLLKNLGPAEDHQPPAPPTPPPPPVPPAFPAPAPPAP
jgi:hypothetical protein